MSKMDLREAIKEGNIEVIKEAIDAGADVNELNDEVWPAKNFPLHCALGSQDAGELANKAIVELLIEKGADVNAKSKKGGRGTTALHYAARNGDKEIVNLLIDNGADVNAVDNSSSWANTPICYAAGRGHKEI